MFFDTFEGPLDLLLYLIRKANIDILDIPMARLTEQYLEYVELMRRRNLELAAEYLLMAALLMEIKSSMLLPRPRAQREEEEDPRAELVRRLMEYEHMKLAAHKLDALPVLGRDFLTVEVWIEQAAVQRLPEVRTEDLIAAWQSLLMRARMTQHHKVTREELSVREFMSIDPAPPAERPVCRFHLAVRAGQGGGGAGGEFSRRAGTGARKPDRSDPVRALCSHLREAGPC